MKKNIPSRRGMYDTIIVGGGIAGLTIAEHLSNNINNIKNTTGKTLILERYPNWGGRIVTNHDPYVYEIGAGRIHASHERVNKLVERFGLKTYPINGDSQFLNEPNNFNHLFEPIRKVLQQLPKHDLSNNTIGSLVPKELHDIFTGFPYYAEIHVLRADLALPLFEPNGTMNSGDYYGIQGGLDQITNNLKDELAKTAVECQTRHRVQDIIQTQEGLFEITGSKGKKAEATPFNYKCKRVIIATEYRSFRNFTILKNAQFLNHLTDSPLTRIYAAYPEPLFDKKIITGSPLRFIIPINEKTGLVMISYTEGPNAEHWEKYKTDKELQDAIQTELRRLFPEKKIPEPTYFKKHAWNQGCTYWKKGNYNIDKTLLEAQNPLTNVYICGESVNRTQSWVESALESAEHLIKIL